MNTADDNYSVMINLHDINSGSDKAFTFPAKTRRYAFFEVTNKDRSYSTNATRLTLATGLEGFEFTESSGRKIRMIHNTTGSSIALNTNTITCPYSNLRMMKSWDETSLSLLTVSNGVGTIPYTSIPKYGHIVIINSNIPDDHVAGFFQYDDVFNASLSFPLNLKTDSAVNAKAYLSWKTVDGATGYKVRRAINTGGPYTTVGTTTDNKFNDSGLTNNSTYYYVVSAINSTMESAVSAEVSAKPKVLTALNENLYQKIQISPNPAHDIVKISNTGNCQISFFDSLGKMVLDQKNQPDYAELNVSGLQTGVYNVRINVNNCLINKKLIIKN